MFCINCGEQIKDGLKFCPYCGAKIAEEPEGVKAEDVKAFQVDQTQVMPPSQTTFVKSQAQPKVYSASAQQACAGQIQEAKSSKAPTVALVIATIVIVIGGVLACLAIVKPEIESLKDTPFSSVQTADENKSSHKKDSAEDSSDEKKSLSTDSKGEGKENNSNDNKKNNDSNNSNSSKSSSGTYVISDSATKRLSSSDIANLTDDQICIAQNEIWARHGRKFENKWLQNHFNQQSWYSGTIEAADFLSTYSPTQIENDNASFLMSALNAKGYDVNKAHPN